MKSYNINGTVAARDIVHLSGNIAVYDVTENNGTLTYTSKDGSRQYTMSTSIEALRFQRPDTEGRTKFNWATLYEPFNLVPFGRVNIQTMPHSGINVTEAGSNRITANGFTAVSDGNYTTYGQFAMHDGHDGTPGDFPAYSAVDLLDTYAVNRVKVWVHSNSIGNFKLQGSNDAGSGAFYDQGTWTDIPFLSSTLAAGSGQYQNAGGWSSGQTDNTNIVFSYDNDTKYRYYRIWIQDMSNPGSSGLASAGYGWACYGYELYRE